MEFLSIKLEITLQMDTYRFGIDQLTKLFVHSRLSRTLINGHLKYPRKRYPTICQRQYIFYHQQKDSWKLYRRIGHVSKPKIYSLSKGSSKSYGQITNTLSYLLCSLSSLSLNWSHNSNSSIKRMSIFSKVNTLHRCFCKIYRWVTFLAWFLNKSLLKIFCIFTIKDSMRQKGLHKRMWYL